MCFCGMVNDKNKGGFLPPFFYCLTSVGFFIVIKGNRNDNYASLLTKVKPRAYTNKQHPDYQITNEKFQVIGQQKIIRIHRK